VTPCITLKGMTGSRRTAKSSWLCTSMKPGLTAMPRASTSVLPRSVTVPTAAIFSPDTATSARTPGTPVPSNTVPPRITRSNVAMASLPRAMGSLVRGRHRGHAGERGQLARYVGARGLERDLRRSPRRELVDPRAKRRRFSREGVGADHLPRDHGTVGGVHVGEMAEMGVQMPLAERHGFDGRPPRRTARQVRESGTRRARQIVGA